MGSRNPAAATRSAIFNIFFIIFLSQEIGDQTGNAARNNDHRESNRGIEDYFTPLGESFRIAGGGYHLESAHHHHDRAERNGNRIQKIHYGRERTGQRGATLAEGVRKDNAASATTACWVRYHSIRRSVISLSSLS